MRILILNWRDPKNPLAGGAEIVTLEHAKFWQQKGHIVTWFSSNYKNSTSYEDLENIKIIRKGSQFTVYLHAFFYLLKNQINYDVVVDEIHGIPFFTPLYFRKPKVAFIHEVAGEIWDYMTIFPLNVLGKIIESMFFKVYSHTYFWTDAVSTKKELMTFGIKPQMCWVIPCPITNNVIDVLPTKEKIPTFLFVSRVVKMKGIEDVLKAFFEIRKKMTAKLWVIGPIEKNYYATLKKIINKFDISSDVTFFGKVSESEKLNRMAKAHILLHASVKEGWGLVVLEAASQGTPSVVYNVSGLKDTVKHNLTGIVVSLNTPEQLAIDTVRLFKNKKIYTNFQKNGINWVKNFSWDVAGEQSLRLLRKVSRE